MSSLPSAAVFWPFAWPCWRFSGSSLRCLTYAMLVGLIASVTLACGSDPPLTRERGEREARSAPPAAPANADGSFGSGSRSSGLNQDGSAGGTYVPEVLGTKVFSARSMEDLEPYFSARGGRFLTPDALFDEAEEMFSELPQDERMFEPATPVVVSVVMFDCRPTGNIRLEGTTRLIDETVLGDPFVMYERPFSIVRRQDTDGFTVSTSSGRGCTDNLNSRAPAGGWEPGPYRVEYRDESGSLLVAIPFEVAGVTSSRAGTSEPVPAQVANQPQPTDTPDPADEDRLEFSSVSVGLHHACGIRLDGSVNCWGSDSSGKATPPAGTFDSISAGETYTCGVRTDGLLRCWGEAAWGRASPPDGKFLSVSAGYGHTCGVRIDGSVACWGGTNKVSGQNWVHFGETTPPEGKFLSVSVGSRFSCGIREDHTMACWGRRGLGEATAMGGLFRSVVSSKNTTCAISMDDGLYCAGGYPGQDWFGSEEFEPFLGKQYRAVSISGDSDNVHICALKTDGAVVCSILEFVNVDGKAAFPQISELQMSHGYLGTHGPSGEYRTINVRGFSACGLLTDNTVNCWGSNRYGQATPAERPKPMYASVPGDNFQDNFMRTCIDADAFSDRVTFRRDVPIEEKCGCWLKAFGEHYVAFQDYYDDYGAGFAFDYEHLNDVVLSVQRGPVCDVGANFGGSNSRFRWGR